MKEFKTIYEESEKEIVEKKSRFIAHVKPIENEEEALNYISGIKSKYWDARHNVYAYVLDDNTQRYSDDGEPQGTAGIPVLQAIKNMNFNKVVVVVTRYFGGVLLGASGLTRTYGKSAKEGLLSAKPVTKKICKDIELLIDYSQLGKVQSMVFNLGYVMGDTVFEEIIKLHVYLPEEAIEHFKKELNNVLNIESNINILGNIIITVDRDNNLLEVKEYE